MAPWIPRIHLFEIDDQPWFPSFLRAYCQMGLTHIWTIKLPLLQPCSPATLVANILREQLGRAVSGHTYIDFCAGAGGPTPSIAQALNDQLAASSSSSSTSSSPSSSSSTSPPGSSSTPANGNGAPSYAAIASKPAPASPSPVKFILTDLHPHIESWERAAKQSSYISYVSEPVNAAAAPASLMERSAMQGKPIFRLFNLAFHHFDDRLARAILKNTVETSDGFGIFELQSRTIASFVSCFLLGFFVYLIAPLLYWWSPQILFFVYVIPVIPFVLVFDGIISSLRTRTADEVEVLLRTCGAGDTSDWVISSGRQTFLWPCGHLEWVVGTKQIRGKETS